MSSYMKLTRQPDGDQGWHMAQWLDDYFGRHQYGVFFPNGKVYRADDYEWEFSDADLNEEQQAEQAAFLKLLYGR